jgi:hypothetical protein
MATIVYSSCPEIACATRSPQPLHFIRSELNLTLDSCEPIRFTGILCSHTWTLTDADRELLHKRFKAGLLCTTFDF